MSEGFFSKRSGCWVSEKRAHQKAGPENAWRGHYKTKSKNGKWYTRKVPACPECGKEMVYRKGRYGEFWGCHDYPHCTGSRSIKNYSKKKPYKKSAKSIRATNNRPSSNYRTCSCINDGAGKQANSPTSSVCSQRKQAHASRYSTEDEQARKASQQKLAEEFRRVFYGSEVPLEQIKADLDAKKRREKAATDPSIEPLYITACKEAEAASNATEYAKAEEKFNSILWYKDAFKMAEKCRRAQKAPCKCKHKRKAQCLFKRIKSYLFGAY